MYIKSDMYQLIYCNKLFLFIALTDKVLVILFFENILDLRFEIKGLRYPSFLKDLYKEKCMNLKKLRVNRGSRYPSLR